MKAKTNLSNSEVQEESASPLASKGQHKRLRKPRRLPRTESPLFTTQAIETTATGAPVISATQAYYKRPEWEEYSPGKLYFQRRFGKGRYVEFYIMNQQEQQSEFITTQAEHEVLERYGVMAARLHAIFATYATRQERPWEQSFLLRGSDLIKSLGLDRRKDMTKAQKLRAIADLAWVVGTLGAVVHWREGKLDLCVTRKSPVWIIQYVEEYFQPYLTEAENGDELCEVIIQIQPGAWTEKFLNREGEQQNQALYQYGYIHKDTFGINPNRQELAAVLTLYLTQNRRARSNCKYRIRTLVEAVIAPSELESIREVRQYRSRFVQRFYETLETMTEAGFQIKFDDSFPKELLPDWAILPDETGEVDPVTDAPSKAPMPSGFFEVWLDGIINISCPSNVEEVLAKLEVRKSKRSRPENLRALSPSPTVSTITTTATPLLQESFTGAVVRKLRKSLNLSQAEVASRLGKSQSWVRDLENKFGDRPVPEDYLEALQEILGVSSNY